MLVVPGTKYCQVSASEICARCLRLIVVGINSVVVDVETDVDMLVVHEVSVVLIICVVVVGSRLMVSTGPGTETVTMVVSVGPGTNVVGPGMVCVTGKKSVSVSVAVVCETTVEVLMIVEPGTVHCQPCRY